MQSKRADGHDHFLLRAGPDARQLLLRFASAIVTALPALVGCTSLDSTDIRTHAIHPDIVVHTSSEGAGSEVRASLKVGGSVTDFVELEPPDLLEVSANGEVKELAEDKVLGTVSYVAALPADAPGTEITVALTRGPDDISAPASKVTLGARVNLASPLAGDVLSRSGAALTLTWTNDPSAGSTDPVSVSWSGSCVESGSRDVPPGETEIILEPGALRDLARVDGGGGDPAAPSPPSCPLTLTVTRRRTGELDSAFGGGNIRHEATASVEITSLP